MIHIDELPLLTQNKSVADISLLYEDLDDKRIIFREACRQFLSRFLMDTDDEHPYECDIVLEPEEAIGLSSLLMPHLVRMWQEPTEGWISFEIDGQTYDFDGIRDNELLQIIEGISKEAE